MVDLIINNGTVIIICYLISIIISAVITVYDKKQAFDGGWRVPEAVLFALGIFGSALSMHVTMLFIHHKTRHKSFMLGLPLISVIKIALLVIIAFFLRKKAFGY